MTRRFCKWWCKVFTTCQCGKNRNEEDDLKQLDREYQPNPLEQAIVEEYEGREEE